MKTLAKSPLAPQQFPDMHDIAGMELRTGRAGYAYTGRDDVLLATFTPGAQVAGVLTQSKTCSPEVSWCRQLLDAGGDAQALWVNAGNSNAFTGSAGAAASQAILSDLSASLDVKDNGIFLASTGVIGEPLPQDKARAAVRAVSRSAESASWQTAAGAIMTTDTFEKGASIEVQLSSGTVRISGIAKGSGMIAPDMATMLSFLFTDAAISKTDLQAALNVAVQKSFNAITVDSDTSTSDTLLVFATQQGAEIESGSEDYVRFARALEDICKDLAHQVVRDGEGAQKFIEIRVQGAVSDASAHKIGMSIANSPLVKTAVAGEDANWGRVVMAVGKAGEPADRDILSIAFGGVEVAANGARVDGFDEAPVAAHLKGQEILIEVGIGLGAGEATVWTCDLTHGYISINADYRS